MRCASPLGCHKEYYQNAKSPSKRNLCLEGLLAFCAKETSSPKEIFRQFMVYNLGGFRYYVIGGIFVSLRFISSGIELS
jgi:hypothetical protein